jgi:hypothetical protein
MNFKAIDINSLDSGQLKTFTQVAELLELLKIKHFNAIEIMQTLEHNSYPYFIPYDLVRHIAHPILLWDTVRHYSEVPIELTSTFRDFKHNKEVGGAKNSMHLLAGAIDGRPVDRLNFRHYGAIERVIKTVGFSFYFDGKLFTRAGLGYGKYKSFFHLDSRGCYGRRKATWIG